MLYGKLLNIKHLLLNITLKTQYLNVCDAILMLMLIYLYIVVKKTKNKKPTYTFKYCVHIKNKNKDIFSLAIFLILFNRYMI